MPGFRCTHIAASIVLLFATFSISLPARAANIVIGVPAWPSAQVTAHIIDQLLRAELGLDTELREQGTLGILSGIDDGEFHVHPEIWLPNLSVPVKRYSHENGTLKLSPLASKADQNICTTAQSVEMTGIDKVSDLSDPDMAAQFDSNADGLGEIWIGAPSWSSTNIEKIRAKSYGYDKTMSLLLMEEDVAMAGVDVAVSLGKPVVFYCYSPHHVFQLHDIRVLEEPEHDSSTWNIVAPADDPSWLAHSSAGSAWAPSSFTIGYAKTIEDQQPFAAQLLQRIVFSPDDSTWMSYQVQVEGIEPAAVAGNWIAQNRDRVDKWLVK